MGAGYRPTDPPPPLIFFFEKNVDPLSPRGFSLVSFIIMFKIRYIPPNLFPRLEGEGGGMKNKNLKNIGGGGLKFSVTPHPHTILNGTALTVNWCVSTLMYKIILLSRFLIFDGRPGCSLALAMVLGWVFTLTSQIIVARLLIFSAFESWFLSILGHKYACKILICEQIFIIQTAIEIWEWDLPK